MNKKLACVKGVLKGSTALSDAEAIRILNDFDAKKRSARRGGNPNPDAAREISEREAIRLRTEAAIDKANAVNNAVKRRALLDERSKYRSDSEAIEAMLVPSNRDAVGARDSVTAKQEAYRGKYLGGFSQAMTEAGLLPYVATRLRDIVDPRKWGKGVLDDKIAIELYELGMDGGKPGKTGSAEALKIAEIVHKFQELARQDLNRLGAYIGKMPGYIVAQTHDMGRISRAGFERWRAQAEKTFGNERTYEKLQLTGDKAADAEVITDFWRGVYYGVSTGQHLSATGESGFKGGSANMAKKASQHRKLHPNSAEDWLAYNDQFGSSSLMEAVTGGLERAAKTAGIMEKLGTNPGHQVQGLISDMSQAAMKELKPVDSRLAQGGFTSRLWDVVDGTADIPARLSVAKLGSAARTFQSIVKLGAAVISSIVDLPVSAAKIRDTYGDNLFSATAENIGMRLAQFTDKGQQREMAMYLRIGFESLSRDIAGRVTSADSVNFRGMQKAASAYFRLNLLSKFQDSGEVALAAMHGARIGKMQDTAFNDLTPSVRDELGYHNIGEAEWDIIRQHSRFAYDSDTPMLIPDKLRDMPLDAIDPLIKTDLDLIRSKAGSADVTERRMNARRELAIQELETKWSAFNIGQVHGGVIRATAREKAYATQGLQAGTPAGEAVRFMMQFKQYPLAFIQQILGRYAQEDRFWSIPGSLAGRTIADPGGVGARVASLITMTTVFGYAAMVLKDLAKGREPRDPRDPRTWGAAFVQGGGAGIYGDYLFAKTNRFGGSLLEASVGPVPGAVFEGADIFLASRDASISKLFGDGETEYPDVKAFEYFKANTPFINLFYTRAALDYLVFYRIQEELSPGVLRRTERNLKKNTGQEFILPPSEVVN